MMLQAATYEYLRDILDLVAGQGAEPFNMKLLCQLCGSPDRPVPNNQNVLLDLIMRKPTQVLIPAKLELDSWQLQLARPVAHSQSLNCSMYAGHVLDCTKSSIWDWYSGMDDGGIDPCFKVSFGLGSSCGFVAKWHISATTG